MVTAMNEDTRPAVPLALISERLSIPMRTLIAAGRRGEIRLLGVGKAHRVSAAEADRLLGRSGGHPATGTAA